MCGSIPALLSSNATYLACSGSSSTTRIRDWLPLTGPLSSTRRFATSGTATGVGKQPRAPARITWSRVSMFSASAIQTTWLRGPGSRQALDQTGRAGAGRDVAQIEDQHAGARPPERGFERVEIPEGIELQPGRPNQTREPGLQRRVVAEVEDPVFGIRKTCFVHKRKRLGGASRDAVCRCMVRHHPREQTPLRPASGSAARAQRSSLKPDRGVPSVRSG